MSKVTILDVLDRAHNGPVCTVKEWDSKVVYRKVSQKVREHNLTKTCDPRNPINMDDSLADEFFKAGFELAAETGMLCQDTERVIEVDVEELKTAIREAPSELTVGKGVNAVTIRHRQPEDRLLPVFTCPLGLAVSEEYYIPILQGIVSNRVIDISQSPSLVTIGGRPVLAATPFETYIGRVEVQMRREAHWRAGRLGMPTVGILSSTTLFGQMGGYNVPGAETDISIVLSPAELKTGYMPLHKAVHTLNYGGIIRSGTTSMLGGYAGGPEGAAVANIAADLLQFVIHQATIGGGSFYDLRYNGTCGREAQWAYSVVCQALARNTHVLLDKISNQVAGPCTDMILYESAVAMLSLAASGACYTTGPRSAGGKYIDHLTPLESWFCAEVFKAGAGMSRRQVNEIIKLLIPKYEDKLMDPPKGKSFPECFDVKTLQPTAEWQALYEGVKRELIDLDVPLDN